jgi:hypothetical protein
MLENSKKLHCQLACRLILDKGRLFIEAHFVGYTKN